MSTRVRRRKARHHRLAMLTPWQRWALTYGKRTGSAFDSPEEWDEAYRLHRDALMAELDDPAAQFRGYWLHEPGVPAELREHLHRQGGVLLPPAQAAAYRRRYDALMQRRRDWLAEQGFR